MGHLLGYARVSTTDQDASLQVDALTRAGCYRVYVDTGSGSLQHRPELDKCWTSCARGTPWWRGGWTGSAGRYAT